MEPRFHGKDLISRRLEIKSVPKGVLGVYATVAVYCSVVPASRNTPEPYESHVISGENLLIKKLEF